MPDKAPQHPALIPAVGPEPTAQARDSRKKPLAIAITVPGAFILCHTVVETTYHGVVQTYADSDIGGLRDFASAFVATSGVILGLLAVFGDKTPKAPFTIKVGVIAPAAATQDRLHTGLVAVPFSLQVPQTPRASRSIRPTAVRSSGTTLAKHGGSGT
jgi:hypothetical protein